MHSKGVWIGLSLLATQTASGADGLPGSQKLNLFAAQKLQILSDQPGEFGKSCSSVLSGDLIYDQYQKLSSRYRVEQYYNWACRSDFSSSSNMKDAGAKLGIPIDGLPVPLSLEGVFKSSNFKESLSEWCSVAWSNLSDQATYEEFSRVVNQGMVSAYKSCIDSEKETLLKKFGVFAYVTPQDDYLRKFIVNIEFRPPTFNHKPRITGVEGSDIHCTHNGIPFQTPFVVTNPTLVLTCTKSVDDSRIIAFNTEPTGASAPSKLPGLSEGVIVNLEQRARGLAQSIKRIETMLATMGSRRDGDTSTINGPRIHGPDQHECPPGTFVSMLHASGSVGGRYAVDGISELKVRCSPLM